MGEENIKFGEGTLFAEINCDRVKFGTIGEITVEAAEEEYYDSEKPALVRIPTRETIEFESETVTINAEILDKLTGGLHRIFNPPFEDRIKLHKRVSRKRYIKLLMSHGISRNEAEFAACFVRALGHPYYYTQQFTMF